MRSVVANGVVYFGSGDGNLYALDSATGDLRWEYKRKLPEDLSKGPHEREIKHLPLLSAPGHGVDATVQGVPGTSAAALATPGIYTLRTTDGLEGSFSVVDATYFWKLLSTSVKGLSVRLGQTA